MQRSTLLLAKRKISIFINKRITVQRTGRIKRASILAIPLFLIGDTKSHLQIKSLFFLV